MNVLDLVTTINQCDDDVVFDLYDSDCDQYIKRGISLDNLVWSDYRQCQIIGININKSESGVIVTLAIGGINHDDK